MSLQVLFAEVDIDKNGHIDIIELCLGLKFLGYPGKRLWSMSFEIMERQVPKGQLNFFDFCQVPPCARARTHTQHTHTGARTCTQ